LKIPITKKRAGGVAQSVGPEFKPQYHKKNKKINKKELLILPMFPLISLDRHSPKSMLAGS
jgi:hypothetical protein